MCSIRGMRRHSASGRPRRHVSFFDIGYEPTTLPTRPSNPLTLRQGRFGGMGHRNIREESVIDHVARDLFKPPPEPGAGKTDLPRSATETGLSIEEQVRKEWDGSNGGLPTF
jgi:hypothetical protein